MASSLARRAFLGVVLASSGDGLARAALRVAGVVPGSMAHRAGVANDDLLVRLGEVPLTSAEALAVALRQASGTDAVDMEVERAGVRFTRRVEVVERPRETLPDTTLRYDAIVSRGARLRTIVTHPDAAAPRPAVLYVQGIADDSIDFGGDVGRQHESSTCRLIHGWARAGLVTMRMERRGLGDSEGGPFERNSFEQELADYCCALDALARKPFVDPAGVFLFGHSVGGMTAPLLARDARVRGVMVYGTSATPWLGCLEASSRRQMGLRGVPPADIEEALARERAELGVAPGDCRSREYHQQLHEADVARAWEDIECPALVLHGEHDWVVGRDEQAQLCALIGARGAELVGARRAARVQRLELPGLDHAMTRHVDLAASLAAYGSGEPDTSVIDATLAWMENAAMNRFSPRPV